MEKKYILGIDEGTSRVKVLIVDKGANTVGFGSSEISTVLPGEGYVEQAPHDIWNTTHELILKTLSKYKIDPPQIAAIGIANQRETTVFWNKKTGMPYGNAALWMDKRTSSLCKKVSETMNPRVVERVGMYIIPNTAAMLAKWMLDNDASIREGMVKTTYGTGCFSIMNVGPTYVPPESGLFSPFLWGNKEDPTYALEGFSEICGAAVDWLMNNMNLIKHPSETEKIARSVKDKKPVYFVPAFNGLGTPELDTDARGTIFGITAETTSAHIVKAVLDGIVYQATDMIKTMESVTHQKISTLRVDGGMAKNDYLCQFQADMLDLPVERPKTSESTALGAIYQAGLTVGFWNSLEEIASLWKLDKKFEPKCSEQERSALYSGWLEAVERSKGWGRKVNYGTKN